VEEVGIRLVRADAGYRMMNHKRNEDVADEL